MISYFDRSSNEWWHYKNNVVKRMYIGNADDPHTILILFLMVPQIHSYHIYLLIEVSLLKGFVFFISKIPGSHLERRGNHCHFEQTHGM